MLGEKRWQHELLANNAFKPHPMSTFRPAFTVYLRLRNTQQVSSAPASVHPQDHLRAPPPKPLLLFPTPSPQPTHQVACHSHPPQFSLPQQLLMEMLRRHHQAVLERLPVTWYLGWPAAAKLLAGSTGHPTCSTARPSAGPLRATRTLRGGSTRFSRALRPQPRCTDTCSISGSSC